MPRKPSARVTHTDNNPHEAAANNGKSRRKHRGKDKRQDGGEDGHTYPQVTIGGRANVHLGDQYHKHADREKVAVDQKPSSVSDLLHLVSTVLDFLAITAPWFDIYPEAYRGLHHVAIDHSLITTALATFRDFGGTLRAKKLNMGSGLEGLVYTGSNSMIAIEAAEKILLSVTSKAIGLTDATESALDDLLVQGVGKTFSDFRTALQSVATFEQLESCRTILATVCHDLSLSLLVLLCSERSLRDIRVKAGDGTGLDFLSALVRFATEYEKELQDMATLLLANRKVSLSEKLLEMQDWLANHITIVLPLLEALEHCKAKSRTTQIQRTIIRSLAFPEMHARYHEILEAEVATFGWIYETESEKDTISSPFAAWLKDQGLIQNNLFWISGKPGSGKSTLMRFLSDDSRTKSLAQHWAHGYNLLIVRSFFWSPGTWLQKSQQGLLRSILYQLMCAQPKFSPEVIPHSWAHLELYPRYQITWKTTELQMAIFDFVKHLEAQTRILLIVDGLDEYHPEEKTRDHEERRATCTLLRSISEQGTVKVCASSRPWNVYRLEFHNCPTLRLEELTRSDIRTFIERRFQASDYFKTWALGNPSESAAFVDGFIERAQGVFLWVRLVVKSLLQGLQNQDDSQDLTRRLEQLPTDLEEYFSRIVSSLDEFYLEQASHIFITALSGPPQLLLLYHFMHSEYVKNLPKSSFSTYDLKRVLHVQGSEDYRINARCMGLLEPINAQRVHRRHKAGVQMVDFLHRTARDFMLTDEMQKRLSLWQRRGFDCTYERVRGIVNLLRSCDEQEPWLRQAVRTELVEDAMELTAGVAWEDRRVWRMLAQIEGELFRLSRDNEDRDHLLHKALATHHSYARYAIQKWDRLPPHNGQPWLDIVINGPGIGVKGSGPDTRNDTCFAIVEDLLALGADPNEALAHETVSVRETVWTSFLESQLVALGRRDGGKASFSLMKILIQNGGTSIVRMGGEDFIKGPDPHTAMRKLFSARKAEHLCKMIDENAEKQPRRKAVKFVLGMLRK